MVLGVLLLDAVYGVMLLGLGVVSVGAGYGAWQLVSPAAPVPVALVAALVAATTAWFSTVLVVALATPRPRPGTYRVMRDWGFFVWALQLPLRRCLDLPPLSTLVMQSSLLRFLMLRAFGARVALTSSMSSDITLLDPALLHVDPGVTIGSQTTVSGHTIVDGRLYLGLVRIERGAEIAGHCTVGPDTRVCAGARLAYGASLSPRSTIGAGARVGAWALILPDCRVGAGARVGARELLQPGTVIADAAAPASGVP